MTHQESGRNGTVIGQQEWERQINAWHMCMHLKHSQLGKNIKVMTSNSLNSV